MKKQATATAGKPFNIKILTGLLKFVIEAVVVSGDKKKLIAKLKNLLNVISLAVAGIQEWIEEAEKN